MWRAVLLMLAAPTSGLRLPAAVQQHVAVACCAAALCAPLPSAAVEYVVSCNADCVKECNQVAPGNKDYCQNQCDAYCAEEGAKGKDDVLRSDANVAENTELKSIQMNNGIFGDSGAVSYSKGIEDLLATTFGATRQAKPLNQAEVGSFVSDISDAAKAAIKQGQETGTSPVQIGAGSAPSGAPSDCSNYKTDAAKAYCAKQNGAK